ncbi:MAG: right-handed parallel beta-helix repeat-containing protein [Deltaproteobacteria bacterium]|nr:right-handed parallel beta-helix repeat-containing protein [Deltaproteobacteria bacterium]
MHKVPLRVAATVSGLLLGALVCCSSSNDGQQRDRDAGFLTADAEDSGEDDATTHDAGADDATAHDVGSDDAATHGSPDGGSRIAIGEWTDAPGTCPAGTTRVDITSVVEMEDASRGDTHTEGTCFFVHDGLYVQRGSTLALYLKRGGSVGSPVIWVGESRQGVIIRGRATIEANDVTLSNMTFDLTGFSHSGAFNTVTVLGDRATISNVSLTGDCATGLRGGHIEISGGAANSLVEACLVERFGQCEGDGHLDHGIYLAGGHDITIRNNVIRENASRGIQLNTEGGAYGTLASVIIERNRIYENGHRDYEDGVVLNGSGTGTIQNVIFRRNLFYRNYYSGIRFSGDAISQILVEENTFVDNGVPSNGPNRSEINLDDGLPEAIVRRNIFVVARTLVNTCTGSLAISDNLVQGDAQGSCVANTVVADPEFSDSGADEYVPTSQAAAGYGAYAP